MHDTVVTQELLGCQETVPQYAILTRVTYFSRLITPLLAGKAADVAAALLLSMAKGVGIIVVVSFSTCWVVPQRGWTGG